MRVESWKFRCQQQCLAEPDAQSTGKPVAFWLIARQNTHASLKPTNLREGVWKELFMKVMKIILQEEELVNSLNHYNLVHEFIPMLQAMNIPDAKKLRWIKNGKT